MNVGGADVGRALGALVDNTLRDALAVAVADIEAEAVRKLRTRFAAELAGAALRIGKTFDIEQSADRIIITVRLDAK